MIYLDKLDGFLKVWARRHPDAPGQAADLLADWLKRHKDNLLAADITVILVGRDADAVPDGLATACDATLGTGSKTGTGRGGRERDAGALWTGAPPRSGGPGFAPSSVNPGSTGPRFAVRL